MGDDDDGSSRRTSPLDRSPRSPASRLGNARIANALACAPVTTESRDASARSGPADDARETEETDGSPAHRMSVYIGTWNLGNTAPRMDAAKAWLAPARGHAIVAVAAQEASYPHSKHNLSPKDVTAELSERKGDSTANPEAGGSTPPSRGTEGKSRGVGWRMTRSKMTRFSGAVAGALAGAVPGGDGEAKMARAKIVARRDASCVGERDGSSGSAANPGPGVEVLYPRGPIAGVPDEHASRRERFAPIDEIQGGWLVELRRRVGSSVVDAVFFSPDGVLHKSFADARREAMRAKREEA